MGGDRAELAFSCLVGGVSTRSRHFSRCFRRRPTLQRTERGGDEGELQQSSCSFHGDKVLPATPLLDGANSEVKAPKRRKLRRRAEMC